jgi:hypothetical protein
MTDNTAAPVGGEQAAPAPAAPVTPASDAPISARDAAAMLANARWERAKKQQAAPVEAAAPAQTDSGQPDDAAPPVEAPSGDATEGQADPPETASIEPPRSWTKEAKERWQSLPRETQEYLATREQERERELRRGQNEAAEKLKGLTAKEQAVEQARQQYEAALPQLMAALQSQQQGEFADIRTVADVEKLAREDWPRYLQWDLAQKKVAAVSQQAAEAQQRAHNEQRQKFAEFAKREDDRFIERAPELSDPKKAEALQRQAMTVLKDLGFEDSELAQAWQGAKDLSLRDHRVQLLIRDATLYRDAQAKAKTAATKPVPPVQRPGTARAANADAEATIQNLSAQLDKASGLNAVRIASQITVAKRQAAARR